VSLDSDIAQLVRPGVRLWMYRPYQRDSVVYETANQVKGKYGVLPEQVPDLKALKGDVSDNIAGVPGVGDKTAARLLAQFDTVENLYEHIDDVTPPKLQQTLRDHQDQVRQGKHLATIVSEAPVKLDLDAAELAAHFDRERVLELFRELEFRSLIARVPAGASPPAGEAPRAAAPEAKERYHIVKTDDEMSSLAERLAGAGRFSFACETAGSQAMTARLVGLAFALGPGEAFYVPLAGGDGPLDTAAVLGRLGPLLADDKLKKAGHNLKFPQVVLARQGLWLKGLDFDSMIAAFLLGESGGARPGEGSLGLRWLVSRRMGIEMPDRADLLGSKRRGAQLAMDEVDIAKAAPFACADADMAGRLRETLEADLERLGMTHLFRDIEMPLLSVLARMELNGVAIDVEALRELSTTLTDDISRLEEEAYKSVGHEFNISSPQQLSHVLFEELHLPKTRRLKTGSYTTDAQALEGLRGLHDVIDLIHSYRELTKLKSTYLDALPALVNPETNRLHTEFNQAGAITGRLSSRDPNLQNIPVRTALGEQVRRAFVARDVAPDSYLLSADYSQVELRIMAHITEDPALVEAFQRDEDIHAATASQVFAVSLAEVTPAMRRRAKVFNFGVLYGLSEYGLSARERISREEAAEFIRTYFEKYPGIKRYVEETVERTRKQGYAETLFGRRRYLPEINSGNRNVRQAAERAAINMPVQGTAADIIKIAMNRIAAEMERRRMRSLLTLQVHDELMFECPADELEDARSLALDIMPASVEMTVPLKIDTKLSKN
jgi:DNA polymerase-1